MDNFFRQFSTLPQYLSGHLILSVSALLLGICISIPLGVFCSRKKYVENYILGFAGIIQTVPSLALLALMVPLLGGTIGAWPAFIALVLYSILPILRNTVTGINEVDQGVVEAARGMGMTSLQTLWYVELPLALPMIVAGIRTSTIWVIGIATLATPVGADCLGYYIFLGLNTRQDSITLFGCIMAAFLALFFDRVIGYLQSALQRREGKNIIFALSALSIVSIVGITCPVILDSIGKSETHVKLIDDINSESSDVVKSGHDLENSHFVIGAKNFTEQYILAEVIANHLTNHGASVDIKGGLGSKVVFDALSKSKVDMYVDYSGTIWATIMKRNDQIEPQRALIKVNNYLLDQYGILSLGALGFENAYAFAMTKKRAQELNVKSISDLSKISSNLSIAGDFDFFGRPEGKHVLKVYNLEFNKQINMNSRLMYDAIKDGTVDIVTAYTSDGQILAFNLVVLADPKNALPPYDAILLLSPKVSQNTALIELLKTLVNSISINDMRWANKLVDLDHEDVSRVGKALYKRILKKRNL